MSERAAPARGCLDGASSSHRPGKHTREGRRLNTVRLALLFFCTTTVALAGAPAAMLAPRLDRTSAPVGDTVTLTLTYSLPAGAHLPEKPHIEGLNGLSISSLQYGSGSITVKFLVDSLTDLTLGPFELTYVDEKGAAQKITGDKVTLKVHSNLEQSPDTQQLKPIRGIIPAQPSWLAYVRWGSLALVIALVAAGLIVSYQRWAGHTRSKTPLLPPHLRARQDLEALVTGGLFERGEVKTFYFRFSEILKRYLEDLRGFPAAEYTSEEIAARIDTEIDRDLLVLLKRSDLVKFADEVPAPARKDEDVKAALAYIAVTAPQPETEEPKGAAG